jgi:hydroxymethylpyrimidine pyrophosphatase-like HAD family hydrolase
MAVKLVALDIDGTIVPGRGESIELPTERLTLAIRRLVEQGIVVVLASGRMFPGTIRIARHLGLTTPVICQQGCSVHLPDGTMTHEFVIEHVIAAEICAYARALGHAYEWFNPLRYVASAESQATRDYGTVSGITPEYHTFPENSGVVPTGVGIISSAGEAPAIHRDLVARYGDRIHVIDFPEVTVAVATDANKGHALGLLCADLGIGREEVIAIGDSVNDASMLIWAGRGYAVAHADRYALEAADEVLPGNEVAVAELLERLVATPV